MLMLHKQKYWIDLSNLTISSCNAYGIRFEYRIQSSIWFDALFHIAVNFLPTVAIFFCFFSVFRSKSELMRRRPRNFNSGVTYSRIFQRLRERALGNGRAYACTGRTINTAPINFSWRNNPLSGATSYHPRHEVEKSSTCSATEFYISLGGWTGNAKEHARLLTLWPNKMKI